LALLHREEMEQIRRALENLPANLREVLVLREFEEMSYTQIATVADIPIGTVMSRLNRARHQLKQMVSFDGEAKEIL
jgi:RNA polymerase sigma-70 factor (ECF subfamily)